MVTKPIYFATEKIISVEDSLIAYQAGTVASPTNTAYTFIPCALKKVLGVTVTPVKLSTTSANSTALDAFELEDPNAVYGISDLPQWAASTGYVVDQIVSYNGKAYQCLESHTSGTSFDATKWAELKERSFLKLAHTAAGSNKVAYFSFVVYGYTI